MQVGAIKSRSNGSSTSTPDGTVRCGGLVKRYSVRKLAYAVHRAKACQKSRSCCKTSKRDIGSVGSAPLRAQYSNPEKSGKYRQFACATAFRNARTGFSVRNLQHFLPVDPAGNSLLKTVKHDSLR